MLGSMEVVVRTAAQQMRTPCNVPLVWVRPKVPAKAQGRRGTRKAWKRRHPPHMTYTFAEPTDLIVLYERMIIATPAQYAAIKRHPALKDKGL